MENTFLRGFWNVRSHPNLEARQSWTGGHRARSGEGWAPEFLQRGSGAGGVRPARMRRSPSSCRGTAAPQAPCELRSPASVAPKRSLLTALLFPVQVNSWGGARGRGPWACALSDFSGGGEGQGG